MSGLKDSVRPPPKIHTIQLKTESGKSNKAVSKKYVNQVRVLSVKRTHGVGNRESVLPQQAMGEMFIAENADID